MKVCHALVYFQRYPGISFNVPCSLREPVDGRKSSPPQRKRKIKKLDSKEGNPPVEPVKLYFCSSPLTLQNCIFAPVEPAKLYFSSLVKNLAKNLVKNLAKNLVKNLAKNLVKITKKSIKVCP